MSKIFCPAPWTSIAYRNNHNSFNVCCEYKHESHEQYNSPEEYFDSDEHRKLREKFIAGEWPEGCEVCQVDESVGTESRRQYYLDNSIPITDIEKPQWQFLDYRPGNLCNLKCRTCGSSISSEINKEAKSNKELHDYADWNLGSNTIIPSWIDDDNYLKNLKHLKILGGEPSIDPMVHRVLEMIGNTGHSSHITLSVTTNLTNVNRRWIELLKKYKNLKINISLDGSGNTFDYIRTNANWNTIQKNINVLCDEFAGQVKRIQINLVYSLYNCFTIDEWLPELHNILNQYPIITEINFINATNPPMLNVKNLPVQFKEIIESKINVPEYKNKILGYTQKSSNNNNVELLKHFFDYTECLDKIRNTDLYSLSPYYIELKKWLTKQ